jgi:16S rRNA (guanine527-N7)-methyltransferase
VTPAARLADGIAELGLDLPADAAPKLLDYLALLSKWNRVYNLTAVRDESEMVVQHLLDSLTVLEHLPAATALVDVGSGAGLPGIPLAIARPRLAVTLVEAVQKKSAFQQQAKIELGLANVAIFCGRVEAMAATAEPIAVVSRAFAELAGFVAAAGHLVGTGGRLFAMKGVEPVAELAALPEGWRVAETIAMAVPGLAARRHLIVLEKL